jgi:hypothetical protein
VGSLVESQFGKAWEYVQNLNLPYAYQRTVLQEEDMIRQFGVLLQDFEKAGTFIYDVTHDSFNEMLQDDTPLIPEEKYFHSLYEMIERGPFSRFKTQLTAPASMCYSIRDSSGQQQLTPQMFHFFSTLMERVGKGYLKHFKNHVQTLFVCLDDPALGFVVDLIETGKAPGLSANQIMKTTDRVLSLFKVPIYHYCYDWRSLEAEGNHLLWNSSPKIAHLDMVAYPPEIDSEQSELINTFLEKGGGIALGVLPNTDSAYNGTVLDVFKQSLSKTLTLLYKSGVDLDLLKQRVIVSTQCGLSGASPELSREIHQGDAIYPEIVASIFKQIQ